MTSEPHTQMHADHRRWLADLAMWQDNLTLWEQEVATATANLARVAIALANHRKAVSCHGAQLRRDHERITNHEEVIAEYTRGQLPTGVVSAVEEHAKEEGRHLQLLRVHEQLKTHHHMIMAKLSLVFKALADST